MVNYSSGALQAWQFSVDAAVYGAKGDGVIGTGGTGTSGTATFTDAGAAFTAADKGKLIIINQGAGGHVTTAPFTGTIAAVNSATSVTLSGNLAANAASAPYIYGTDDAAAINAAIVAAVAYAQAHNYHAQVVFSEKNYMLGALTQASTPDKYNTHLKIPVIGESGRKVVLDFTGPGAGLSSGVPQYWQSLIPNIHGACLVSAVSAAAQPDATFGQQSVIGGPNALAAGTFSNVCLVLSGITIVAPYNSQQYGVDATFLTQMNVPDAAYQCFAPVNLGSGTVGGPWLDSSNIVNNGVSAGFAWPRAQDNDASEAGQVTVEGASVGVQITDHFNAQKLNLLYCNQAIQVNVGAAVHGAVIQHASVESCNYALYNASTGGQYPIIIGSLDQEQVNIEHVHDPSNFLNGRVNHYNSSASRPVLNGGAALEVIDVLHNGPGHMASPPAVPATTVAATLIYRNAWVVITSGGAAVSAITVDGAATGLTLGASGSVTVRVPAGKTIALTYASTAPTWAWWLD